MSWIAASIGIGAGALLSYEKNKQAQANEKQQMLANAAQIQYSPWTGAPVQVKGPTVGSNTLAGISGGLQGGLTGYTLGQGIKSAGAPAAAAGAAPANQQPVVTSDNMMNNQSANVGNPWVFKQTYFG